MVDPVKKVAAEVAEDRCLFKVTAERKVVVVVVVEEEIITTKVVGIRIIMAGKMGITAEETAKRAAEEVVAVAVAAVK